MKNVDHDDLEDLLRHASPRPVPSAADEAEARAAVHKEWRAVAGTRRRRRRVVQYALAASLVLATFIVFNSFRMPAVSPFQVGTIARNFGPVYLMGEGSELRETVDLANIMTGQTIVTGAHAGLAIVWGRGGSLRVDENTRIAFLGEERIRLENGRIYFDSVAQSMHANMNAPGDADLVIESSHGDVRHVGTQYMVRVDQQAIVVSVREGQVDVEGRYHRQVVNSGQQVTMSGTVLPAVLSIGRAGGQWSWVDKTSPATDVDGKSLHEYLTWACREMGLDLVYEGGAETRAREADLRGTIDMRPTDALPLRLASVDLRWRIDEGVIYISD